LIQLAGAMSGSCLHEHDGCLIKRWMEDDWGALAHRFLRVSSKNVSGNTWTVDVHDLGISWTSLEHRVPSKLPLMDPSASKTISWCSQFFLKMNKGDLGYSLLGWGGVWSKISFDCFVFIMLFGKFENRTRKRCYRGRGQNKMTPFHMHSVTKRNSKSWKLGFLMSGKTKSGETSTEKIRMVCAVILDSPYTFKVQHRVPFFNFVQ